MCSVWCSHRNSAIRSFHTTSTRSLLVKVEHYEKQLAHFSSIILNQPQQYECASPWTMSAKLCPIKPSRSYSLLSHITTCPKWLLKSLLNVKCSKITIVFDVMLYIWLLQLCHDICLKKSEKESRVLFSLFCNVTSMKDARINIFSYVPLAVSMLWCSFGLFEWTFKQEAIATASVLAADCSCERLFVCCSLCSLRSNGVGLTWLSALQHSD